MKFIKSKDEGVRILTYGLFGNIFLMFLKGVIGLLFSSQALTADAVNSASDVMTTFVVLMGLRYSLKPHDEDHHYGHGKMEALVSLFVGFFILAGIGFLAVDIIGRLKSGEVAEASYVALSAAIVSVAVKAVMYKKTVEVGRKINSIGVMTSAKDYRNDILTTSGAAAAILLAIIGQKFGVSVLRQYSEPVMASVIALFIVKTAIEIITESSKMLLDAAPDRETVEKMRHIVEDVDGVIEANWVKCRKMGRGLLVDAAIEVDGVLSVQKGHDIGDEVKFAVMAKYPEVIDVVIHINPN